MYHIALKHFLYVQSTVSAQSCCVGIRGNVDGGADDGTAIGSIDIADLVPYLVDYSFGGGPAPSCIEEADVDASGDAIPIDIAEIVYLVSFMFAGGPEPVEYLHRQMMISFTQMLMHQVQLMKHLEALYLTPYKKLL